MIFFHKFVLLNINKRSIMKQVALKDKDMVVKKNDIFKNNGQCFQSFSIDTFFIVMI